MAQISCGAALALMFGVSSALFLNVSFFLALTEVMPRLDAALTVTGVCVSLTALFLVFALRSFRRGRTELTKSMKASAVVIAAPPAARLASRHLRVVGFLAAAALAMAAARGRKAA